MKRGLLFFVVWLMLLLVYTGKDLRASDYNKTPIKNLSSIASNDPQDKSITIESLYPNPVRSELNIEISTTRSRNINILVFNLLGQQVSNLGEHYISDFDTNTLTFDISSLKPGLYIVTIKSDTALKSMKVRKIQ
ncbi:MAG: T9SS type A sorting domain-containing protein [Bacteroidales bacterium]